MKGGAGRGEASGDEDWGITRVLIDSPSRPPCRPVPAGPERRGSHGVCLPWEYGEGRSD